MAAGRREARGAKELPVGRLAPPLWVAPAGKREQAGLAGKLYPKPSLSINLLRWMLLTKKLWGTILEQLPPAQSQHSKNGLLNLTIHAHC